VNPTNDTDVIRRLTVQRTPDALHSHRITAQLVDRSGSQPSKPTPIEVSSAFSAELTRLLPDFVLSPSQLEGRLDASKNQLCCELYLASLLRRQLGWTNLASESLFGRGARLPSQLLGLRHDPNPAVRHLTPVVVYRSYGTCIPWQLPVLVTTVLENALCLVGAASVDWTTGGYRITAQDPSSWHDAGFEARVLYQLLRYLDWDADEFTLVYADPATETTGH